jgi:hypothetical protein
VSGLRTKDIVGMKYARLTVIRNVGKDSGGNALWLCECSCGGQSITRGFMLSSGRTRSCGCMHKEVVSKKKPRVIVSHKICSCCGILKTKKMFGRRKTSTDGMSSHCNHCKNVFYKQNNSGKVNATNARRKKHISIATPPWSDLLSIRLLYEDCQKVSAETGIKHHVDHIVPLRGKSVCGLHILHNLQIIPAALNLTKGSRL